jgi:D-sedoheptulose 7-phosphate isomerase
MPTFASQIETSLRVIASLNTQAETIEQIAHVVRTALLHGQKLLTCGNGGSSADSMHLAEELIGRYRSDRRPYPAICLAADSTALTCIANDFGYDHVFARQVEALGVADDVLICFTTSGKSPNILAAIEAARVKGLTTIALLGKHGGLAKGLANYEVIVESEDSGRIQEAHMQIVHYICEVLES